MQAIQTKYLCPTNHRGARIKATCERGSMTIPWDHALNVDDNHRAALSVITIAYGWHARWVTGTLADGTHVHTWDVPGEAHRTGRGR